MKKIRTKLFLVFVIFMVSLVFCGILFNALFLQDYYIYKNKDIFIEKSKEISEEYKNNKKNIDNFIDEIDRIDGISCTITDKNFNMKYNSFPKKAGPDGVKLPKEIEELANENQGKLLKTYIYSIVEKEKGQAPKIVFLWRMNNGDLIILTKPLKGINESVSIANQFYLLAGIIIILIGGAFIFLFSKKITSPIIEMSNVAENISNLDFNKRVSIDTQDEIGSLGKSINKISEKLNRSMNELKQDIERRKQLVRNMSHELKTPIGVIKGYAEGLKYGVADDKEKIDKYCTVIVEECDQMDNMVRELLSLSILESGMFRLNITTFNIVELIRKIIEVFTPELVKKGITIDFKCDNNGFVTADYELIERVIKNFIINAINHAEGKKYINVALENKEEGIKITVFNTGKHILEKDLKNIWDVFYKVDKARSRKYGGHGMGLSIVRLIAEFHGDSVGVKNVDEGVKFYYLFH